MSHGKKIGQVTVVLDRLVDERPKFGCIARNEKNDRIVVDLRFDTHTGLFHSKFEGEWFSAKTQDELKDKIKKVADVKVDLVWKRYITISYHAEVMRPGGHGGTDGYGSTYLGLDRADKQRRFARDEEPYSVIKGIELGWDIFELSEPYKLPGKHAIRSRREFDTEKRTVGQAMQLEDDEIPENTVEWTEEREKFLVHVREALSKLDAKLVELFSGDMEQLAEKLDAAAHFSLGRLLESPKR